MYVCLCSCRFRNFAFLLLVQKKSIKNQICPFKVMLFDALTNLFMHFLSTFMHIYAHSVTAITYVCIYVTTRICKYVWKSDCLIGFLALVFSPYLYFILFYFFNMFVCKYVVKSVTKSIFSPFTEYCSMCINPYTLIHIYFRSMYVCVCIYIFVYM